MKKKVIAAFFKKALTTPPLGGSTFINGEKMPGIKMCTGEEPGFLSVEYQGKLIGVPLSNVSDLVWEKEPAKQ